MIASGTASVVLTVWGRLMPPDTWQTRTGFVFVGIIAVGALITAATLNSRSQEQLITTITTMAENVGKLAAPANVDPKSATTDQILSAAAAKLLQQDGED
jgi:hypothetical protein